MTIRALAEKAQISKDTVVRIERGEESLPETRDKIGSAVGYFADAILTLDENLAQLAYKVEQPIEHHWKVSFFQPDRKLPHDVEELIQDSRERARFAKLGWISRYECNVVPRLAPELPTARLMEIWHKNGAPATHPEVELAYAVKGGVRIYLANDVVELREGAGISFQGNVPHDYEPLDKEAAPSLVLYIKIPVQDSFGKQLGKNKQE